MARSPPRSRSLAWGPDAGFFVAVNPDLGVLYVGPGLGMPGAGSSAALFSAADSPSSVALTPDGRIALVALRHAGALALVGGLPSAPQVMDRRAVCSEPAAVAIAPGGNPAVVACAGEAAVMVIDLGSMVITRVETVGAARAIAITDDGDADGWDEKAYVPAFFGQPTAEGSDRGRMGQVTVVELATRATHLVQLAPIANAGFGPPLADGGEGAPVACSPNQLAAIAILGARAYVAHTCVAPEAPVHGPTSLFAGLSVIDLSTDSELTGPEGSVSLSGLARSSPSLGGSLLGLPVDLEAAGAGRLVVLSQAGNRIAVLAVGPGQPVTLVSPPPPSSGDLFFCGYVGCAGTFDGGGSSSLGLEGVPIGLAAAPETGTLLVNEWNARSVLTVSLNTQSQPRAPLFLAPPPDGGTLEHRLLLGRKFFYTGRERWAAREVGSCASCHPDGLSDNVTWMFPAGPRQTLGLDGTFTRGDPSDHRAQNWTAIFDEVYDVEGITRSLLGGKGAITEGPPPVDTPVRLSAGISLDGGALVTRNDGLSGSSRAVVAALSQVKDWEEIDLWVQRVRTNRAPTNLVPGDVSRGRQLFAQGGCPSCHGGPRWSVSRIPYEPSPEKNGSLPGDNGLPAAPTGLRTELLGSGAYKVAMESVANPDGGAALSIGPERITCVLRDVGTWRPTNPLEKKPDGSRSQGALGFNPPSLLGLGTSAPYLHDGAARTLGELFTNAFAAHARAGNPNFLPGMGTLSGEAADIAALTQFLLSIDGDTTPFAVPANGDICGAY